MLKSLIAWSVHNRFLVLLAALVITGWGWVALHKTPLDAIPDLSDVQVIIRTGFPGQAPQVVEEQVTYPITTALRAVPGAVARPPESARRAGSAAGVAASRPRRAVVRAPLVDGPPR